MSVSAGNIGQLIYWLGPRWNLSLMPPVDCLITLTINQYPFNTQASTSQTNNIVIMLMIKFRIYIMKFIIASWFVLPFTSFAKILRNMQHPDPVMHLSHFLALKCLSHQHFCKMVKMSVPFNTWEARNHKSNIWTSPSMWFTSAVCPCVSECVLPMYFRQRCITVTTKCHANLREP